MKSVGLLANVLAQQQARENGAQEALFVRHGLLQEGTHSNLFAVLGERLITPPLTQSVLPGITRQVVLELCRALALPISEAPISAEKVSQIDEFFITGTTVEITPVIEIAEKRIGDGEPGEITRRLQSAFGEIVETAR